MLSANGLYANKAAWMRINSSYVGAVGIEGSAGYWKTLMDYQNMLPYTEGLTSSIVDVMRGNQRIDCLQSHTSASTPIYSHCNA